MPEANVRSFCLRRFEILPACQQTACLRDDISDGPLDEWLPGTLQPNGQWIFFIREMSG